MSIPAFTPAVQQRLAAFLSAPERHAESMCYAELAGFLFAVVCCPDMVQPSEWLEQVLHEDDTGYSDEIQMRETLGDLMALYNVVNAGVLDREPSLPTGCEWRDPDEANFDTDSPISQWSQGFMDAFSWLEKSWFESIPKSWEDDLGTAMFMLSFFASRELAEIYLKESEQGGKKGAESVEEMAAVVRGVFTEAMGEFADMGRSLHAAAATPPEAARSTKVQRNAPCPCGSGNKYKKCCGLRH